MTGAIDLPVSHVFRRKDARPTDEAALRGLVSSIAELGIIHPLRVRPAQRHVDGVLTDAYEVTAGAHRLKAALKLGLETVPCVIVADDDLHAELVMIDENLMRAELSPAERAKQTARRKALYLELHPETGHGKASPNKDDNLSSFAEATADATGRDKRTVQRDSERGEKVAPDVLDRVAGTHLDTGSYLDQLKKLPPEDQRQRVERALTAKPAKIADVPLNDFEARERQVARLMAAWNAASPEARADFLARIDRPVMDQRWGDT